MIKPNADSSVLAPIVARGGHFMPVSIEQDVAGKWIKKPMSGWNQLPRLPYTTTFQPATAYGFCPPSAKLWVLDLDEKGTTSGLASILANIVDPGEWLDFHEPRVETPNGTHYYFNLDSVPYELRISANSIGGLKGVDIRGDEGRYFLVAPGSWGISAKTGEWTQYRIVGTFDDVPDMPEDLRQLLLCFLTKQKEKDRQEEKTAPEYLVTTGRTGFENITEEDRAGPFQKLFDLAYEAGKTQRVVDEIVKRYAPNSYWDESQKRYKMGGMDGRAGGSGYISATFGVGDWSEHDKPTNICKWLSSFMHIPSIEAARIMLSIAGVPDPTQTIKPAIKPQETPLTSFAWTDTGNAERLLNRFGDKLQFVHEYNTWFVWNPDKGKWSEDKTGLVRQASITTARAIPEEAAGLDEKTADKLREFARASESNKKLKDMVEIAASINRINESHLDKELDFFNVANGMVNLRTGELVPHDKSKYFTRASTIRYNPGAECPRFLAFLSEIMQNRQELVDWLRVFFGYCLSGKTTQHTFTVFYGNGRNGKSALVEIIAAILDEYQRPMRPESLMRSDKQASDTYALAAARGARLVTSSESETGAELSIARVKEISGGESIECRAIYGKPFSYKPTWKVVLLTNHKPRVKAQDEGTWRRLRYIPFDWTCPEDQVNPDLAAEIIRDEAEGVLAWLVSGAMEWYEKGLPHSTIIDTCTKDYREDEDALHEFIAKYFFIGSGKECPRGRVYDVFNAWCEARKQQPYNRRTFYSMMEERGFKKWHNRDGDVLLGLEEKGTPPF